MPAWAFLLRVVVFKLTFVTINLSFFLMCNIFLSPLSFLSFLSWAGLGVYILAISWNICGEGYSFGRKDFGSLAAGGGKKKIQRYILLSLSYNLSVFVLLLRYAPFSFL